jgi:hypothetical protein
VTIAEWLQSRQPRPPLELMESLEAALGPALKDDASKATAAFLTAAERMLRDLVSAGETGRPVASVLLAIDALTTYAVEAATEQLDSVPDFAEDAMARFANIIQPGSANPKP